MNVLLPVEVEAFLSNTEAAKACSRCTWIYYLV